MTNEVGSNGHDVEQGSAAYDAIVAGAGFGGIRMLAELRRLGLKARVLEAAPGIGGTWYWNRYPGARTDTECWYYCFSFSKEIIAEWTWPERYAEQAEVLAYLEFVVDRLDLRKDIEVDARVESAVFDEDTNRWTISTVNGDVYTAKYYITANGLLSAPVPPPYEGVEDFRGDYYVTGTWPHDVGTDFQGKRVAVIGTGATAVQAIPVIAHTAAQLTVFQRTATYVIPARNHTIDDAQRRAVHRQYDDLWKRTETHAWALPYEPRMGRVAADLTAEQQEAILERCWETGTFRFLFETWDDVFTNVESNKIVTDFICRKIHAFVDDPATAATLTPNDHHLGAKRPPLGQFYYETFNRDNVTLVDLKDVAIDRILEQGIRMQDGRVLEFDVLIFATGFDAVTGALVQQDIRGVESQQLAKRWEGGPQTYMSVAVDGFPNMFMVLGPQGPFAILTVAIEHIVQFIGTAIEFAERNSIARFEAKADVVESWCEEVSRAVDVSLAVRGKKSWLWGANVPGKAEVVLQYLGGNDVFIKALRDSAANDFAGFELASASIEAAI